MKPLKRIKEIIKEISVVSPENFSLLEHREALITILNNSVAVIRLTDGKLLNVTLNSDNKLMFEEIEPYYEFDSEKEIRDWVESDNEFFFENVVRWHKLKNVLDGDDEPLK
jgi:hypothetical protein